VTAAVADEAQRRIEGPTPIVRMRFGENLERLRRERGCSFDTLAAGSRIERSHVEEMVRGERKVRAEELVLLAGALDVTADDLMEGINWITAAEGGPRWEVAMGGRR
jgi:transcriptional regulator with XRE-family HTH domain